MYTLLYIQLFVAMLASRVLASGNFNITLNNVNITASQFINVSDSGLTQACSSSYQSATDAIASCGDANAACLCNTTTVSLITGSEQCFFQNLISRHAKSPDGRAGEQTALTAYGGACLNATNVTVPTSELALHSPPGWDGPESLVLGTGATVAAVMAATVLGASCIGIIVTM